MERPRFVSGIIRTPASGSQGYGVACKSSLSYLTQGWLFPRTADRLSAAEYGANAALKSNRFSDEQTSIHKYVRDAGVELAVVRREGRLR